MSFLPLYVYFIIISFLASLSVYFISKDPPVLFKIISPFFIGNINSGIAWDLFSIYQESLILWLYNFFTVFEFCFYLWIISLIINNKRCKENYQDYS